jgi:interferon-induced transmembrane protein
MPASRDSRDSRRTNQFVWSILCTVMCWMPLGIVAIINSSKGCMDG